MVGVSVVRLYVVLFLNNSSNFGRRMDLGKRAPQHFSKLCKNATSNANPPLPQFHARRKYGHVDIAADAERAPMQATRSLASPHKQDSEHLLGGLRRPARPRWRGHWWHA